VTEIQRILNFSQEYLGPKGTRVFSQEWIGVK